MPEQLSKHPEVTLQVLRSAGAACGEGRPQAILKQCPAEQFCKLPGGEVCIYGLPDAARMTQITLADWKALLQQVGPADPTGSAAGEHGVLIGGAALVAGLLLGVVLMKLLRR